MNIRSSNRFFLSLVIFCISTLAITQTICAQIDQETKQPENDFKSHLYFGGGFGLQFGFMTLIEVSPLVGYNVTPKFSVGISPTYKFYKYNDYYGQNLDLKTNVWGGSIFSRYYVFENVFAHVEYESLLYNSQTPNYPETKQQFNSFFVGGGYNQRIGGNSGMYILVLWNLNDTPDSPYTNPVIRVGFTIGI